MLKRIRDLLGGRRKKKEVPLPAPAPPPSEPARPRVHRGPEVVHRPIAASDLDPDAVKIVHRLNRFNYSAYFVGGCVRDLLLERKPKDFDIGTAATPRQVKRLFRNCRIIGRRFRLAHIYFQNGKIIEVATFRALDPPDEAESGDLLIRDDNVFGTPEEDALRRDFTINSLFYDLRDETVLDHADGLGDLRRRLVRCIGDPQVRFREDPIRCLRAIKFAARLDFAIEADTLRALKQTREEIPKAASARILEEINRMCRGGAARRSFELLRETGVLDVILPEFAQTRGDGWDLSLELLGRMDRARFGDQREIRTGEILGALLLPLLAPEVGWRADGKIEPFRDINLRDMIDERLRPIALRLRVPRREQEYCRQLLASLFRMVPVRRLRRNAKRAILRRECMADALWMLEAMVLRYGADFAEALEFWKQAPEQPQAAPGSAPERAETEAAPPGGRRRRSRRRRSSTGKRYVPPPDVPSAPPKRDLPPVWDDDYFFAALPEVPDTPREEDEGPRYGGIAVGIAVEEGEKEAATPEAGDGGGATPGGRPRRRRRSRRGRRRLPPTTGGVQVGEPEDEGTGSDKDPREPR